MPKRLSVGASWGCPWRDRFPAGSCEFIGSEFQLGAFATAILVVNDFNVKIDHCLLDLRVFDEDHHAAVRRIVCVDKVLKALVGLVGSCDRASLRGDRVIG